ESFGSCEAAHTSAEISAAGALAEQAAAQGITYTVSSGDTGAEGCDNLSEIVATGAVSVNFLASTPFNVAVGGTIFNEGTQSGKYWSSSLPLAETALSYIRTSGTKAVLSHNAGARTQILQPAAGGQAHSSANLPGSLE